MIFFQIECFKSDDLGHGYKKLTYFFEKNFIILFIFLIKLFQLHNLDCEFSEISYINLVLIRVVINLYIMINFL